MIEVRTPAAPVEVVTPILPSEAIRLGCLTTRQAFGSLFGGGRRGMACVMGTMIIGFGGDTTYSRTDAIHRAAYAARRASGHTCPESGCRLYPTDEGKTLPAHLNDDHRWSRERIADWLEGLGL